MACLMGFPSSLTSIKKACILIAEAVTKLKLTDDVKVTKPWRDNFLGTAGCRDDALSFVNKVITSLWMHPQHLHCRRQGHRGPDPFQSFRLPPEKDFSGAPAQYSSTRSVAHVRFITGEVSMAASKDKF